MPDFKNISVVSFSNIGSQVLRDNLTKQEKRILLLMLNLKMTSTFVGNKKFHLVLTKPFHADVKISTKIQSQILNRFETTVQNVQIKFS
jgi:hypothetical protein